MSGAPHRHTSAPRNTRDQERGPPRCAPHAGSQRSRHFRSWKGIQEPWGAVGALPDPWLGLGHGSRRLSDNQFCILPPRSPENHFTEQNEDTEMRFRRDTTPPAGPVFHPSGLLCPGPDRRRMWSRWASLSHSPLRGPRQWGEPPHQSPRPRDPYRVLGGLGGGGGRRAPSLCPAAPHYPGPRCPARGPTVLLIRSSSPARSRGPRPSPRPRHQHVGLLPSEDPSSYPPCPGHVHFEGGRSQGPGAPNPTHVAPWE